MRKGGPCVYLRKGPNFSSDSQRSLWPKLKNLSDVDVNFQLGENTIPEPFKWCCKTKQYFKNHQIVLGTQDSLTDSEIPNPITCLFIQGRKHQVWLLLKLSWSPLSNHCFEPQSWAATIFFSANNPSPLFGFCPKIERFDLKIWNPSECSVGGRLLKNGPSSVSQNRILIQLWDLVTQSV